MHADQYHHQTVLINAHDQTHQHQPPQPEAKVMNVELEPSFFKTGKPRLRWTPELHARFIHAANKLGGLSGEYIYDPHIYLFIILYIFDKLFLLPQFYFIFC